MAKAKFGMEERKRTREMDERERLEKLSAEPSYVGLHELTGSLTDVLSESRTMLSAVGLIFAFLLNASLFLQPDQTRPEEFLLLLAALSSSMLALMLFSMPVIYHHLEFPYRNVEKFVLRSHNFISWGMGFFVVTIFLGLALAFYRKLGPNAFLFAGAIFALLALIYRVRSREILVHAPPGKTPGLPKH